MGEEKKESLTAKRLLEEARLVAVDRRQGWPFFVDTLYAMTRKVVWTEDVSRAAVDKWWRLYLNPRWLEKEAVTAAQLAAVLMHEGWHLLQEYWRRAALKGVPESLAELWNVAADAVVNQIDRLSERLPGDHVRHSDLGLPPNGTVEEYYDQLLKKLDAAKKAAGQKSGSSASGSGLPISGRGAASSDGSPDSGGDSSGSGGSGSDPTQPGAGSSGRSAGKPSKRSFQEEVAERLLGLVNGPPQSGSGTHGHKRPWELGPPSKEEGGISRHEQEQILAATARRILEEKSRGTVPGAAAEWAEAFATPKVDWRRELAAAVALGAVSSSYGAKPTYRKLSRRYSCGPVVRPGRETRKPRVAVAIDTSGSMSGDDLSAALAEVQAILERTSRTLLVACVDAEVQQVSQVSSAKKLQLHGRGGTDMCKALQWADDLHRKGQLDLLVLLTDGMTPWPAEPPRFELVVGWVHRKGAVEIDGPQWVKDSVVPIEVEVEGD